MCRLFHYSVAVFAYTLVCTLCAGIDILMLDFIANHLEESVMSFLMTLVLISAVLLINVGMGLLINEVRVTYD